MRRYLPSLLLLAAVGCSENRVPQQQVAQNAPSDTLPADSISAPPAAATLPPKSPTSDTAWASMISLARRFNFLGAIRRGNQQWGRLRSHNMAVVAPLWNIWNFRGAPNDPRLKASWQMLSSPFECDELLDDGIGVNDSFQHCAQAVGLPWREERVISDAGSLPPDTSYILHYPDSTRLHFVRWPYFTEKPKGAVRDFMMLFPPYEVYSPQMRMRGGLRVGSHRREVMAVLRPMVLPVQEFDNVIVMTHIKGLQDLEFHLRADTVYRVRCTGF